MVIQASDEECLNQSGGGRDKEEYMDSRTLLEMKLLELVSDKVDVEDESQWPRETCAGPLWVMRVLQHQLLRCKHRRRVCPRGKRIKVCFGYVSFEIPMIYQ